jgi:hypothetical protein
MALIAFCFYKEVQFSKVFRIFFLELRYLKHLYLVFLVSINLFHFLLFLLFFFSFLLFISFCSREIPMQRWRCSRKPGYYKHHSNILHSSSSSKGKLLALIECGTNPFSLSLQSFPLSLLYHRWFSRGKRGFRKVTSNIYSAKRGRTSPATDPRDDLIIPASIRASATRVEIQKTLQCRIPFRIAFLTQRLVRDVRQIFNARFSRISPLTFANEKCNNVIALPL